MNKIPFSIKEISNAGIEELTQILYPYPEIPSRFINGLSRELRRPIAFQRPSTNFLRRSLSTHSVEITRCSKLCKAHRFLNGQIIALVFDALRTEIGIQLSHLVADSFHTTTTTQESISSLQDLNALWLPASDFSKIYSHSPDPKWAFQSDGCEACILARIPGDSKMLANIYATVQSRKKKGKERPEFARLVEAWIRWSNDRDSIFKAARRLKRIFRRDRTHARRRRKGLPPLHSGQQDSDEDDSSGENVKSVEQHYAQRPLPAPPTESGSSTSLPPRHLTIPNLHRTGSRRSVSGSTPRTTLTSNARRSRPPPAPSAYSLVRNPFESSLNVGGASSTSRTDQQRPSADARSQQNSWQPARNYWSRRESGPANFGGDTEPLLPPMPLFAAPRSGESGGSVPRPPSSSAYSTTSRVSNASNASVWTNATHWSTFQRHGQ
ncbi:MAG: hypothetical protein M1814_000405 [Vezdaea aestivalis]|nr:MAG: hypothetical protein M1814_000405 [Vezdaea aestivalis]